jgi:phage-related protein (TIGR01555 family)
MLPASVQAAVQAATPKPASPGPSAPAARTDSGAPEVKTDGWQSIMTGLGTSRDKRTSGFFGMEVVTDAEARELWRGDDLAAHAIETYPDEMLRAGWDLSIQVDDEEADGADKAREDSAAVEALLTELNCDENMRDALCKERAFGGAAIWPVLNDGAGNLAMPLREQAIVSVDRLVVFEARELQPAVYYSDPTKPSYGRPAIYRLQPLSTFGSAAPEPVYIHESRLIIFPGIWVSRGQISPLPGWGDGVLTRVKDVLRDYNMGFSSVSHLLNDFAQAIFKVRGLFAAVAADEAGLMKRRMEIMDASRSILRAILLDAGDGTAPPEEFDRKTTPLTGVPDVLDPSGAAPRGRSRRAGLAPHGHRAGRAQRDRRRRPDLVLRPGQPEAGQAPAASADAPDQADLPEQGRPDEGRRPRQVVHRVLPAVAALRKGDGRGPPGAGPGR